MPLPSPAFTHSHFSESFQNLDGVRAGANTTKMRPLARGAEGSVEVMSVSSYSDHLDSSTSHQLTNQFSSVQFSSVAQLCPTHRDPMNHSMPGLPVHHQLPEPTQTHAHQVGDAIQPSHPLSCPSPPAPNPSQHHGLFQ